MSRAAEALLRSLVVGAPPVLPACAHWPDVEEILESHRLAPWVWAAIEASGEAESLPFEVRARLYAAHWRTAEANRAFALEAATALGALREAGVDPIVLKGMALLNAVYRDAGARPMEDIDWLISADERPRAHEVLEELGFERAGGARDADVFAGPEGLTLDLHHRFRLLEGRDLSALTETKPAPLIGIDAIRMLGPEATLAHLVFHLGGHRSSEGILLGWVLDVAMALREWGGRLDLDAARDLLPAGPARRSLGPVLGFCVHRLGVPWSGEAPPDVWRFDRIVRVRRRAAWNLSSPRGWLALGASWLGVEPEHERPRLHRGDLVRAPLDWLVG